MTVLSGGETPAQYNAREAAPDSEVLLCTDCGEEPRWCGYELCYGCLLTLISATQHGWRAERARAILARRA